ncbi:MAG: hypothetical protein K9M98_07030 [Cephaloticoccus sp.]|nr:hypothetical protein [Cephaloticoccus sp.]MCF7760242.1 hypothetical protein [Cephaloticoccus sp.]
MRNPLGLLSSLLLAMTLSSVLNAQPVRVELRQTPAGFELLRGGAPFYVRGAGGTHHLKSLAAAGANSVRTWGTDLDSKVLDEAQQLGLTVCAGIWIEHERHGFDYDDAEAVATQIEQCKRIVDQFKDHPALLLWSVGNEVETRSTNPKVWDTIEAVAAYIKKIDPNHPVMVVTTHPLPKTLAAIRQHCPSIDLLGCNTYAGLPALQSDLRRYNWTGAYLVTEWGTNGNWESPKTPWGAELEPTSTEKALTYAERYAIIQADQAHCLGSYAFYWGQKQEATPTWFNLYTEDGAETEGVEMLQSLWTGQPAAVLAPRITPLQLNEQHADRGVTVKPDTEMKVAFAITRGNASDLRISWELLPESPHKGEGGDFELRPQSLPLPAPSADAEPTKFAFAAPQAPGAYRLFLMVHGPGNKVATANFPFLVGSVADK